MIAHRAFTCTRWPHEQNKHIIPVQFVGTDRHDFVNVVEVTITEHMHDDRIMGPRSTQEFKKQDDRVSNRGIYSLSGGCSFCLMSIDKQMGSHSN